MLALAIALAQLAVVSVTPSTPEISVVILGNSESRERLEPLLERLSGAHYRSELAGGMGYAGCVAPWRGDRTQTDGCIQSRLPRGRPTIVLNTYGPTDRTGTTVYCIGSGGSAEMTLRPKRTARDGTELQACLDGAAPGEGLAPPAIYGVRYTEELEIADAEEARAHAASVLAIAVDHVGVPRGIRGHCLIQGRVVGVVRGAGLTPRGLIDLALPCDAGPERDTPRRISTRELAEGSFGEVYLDDRHVLLDYRRVASPAE
ncbi:hypothetical protein E2493_11915 [Sphingomonas parva]|uniref:Uncharacterized protein n=1 Tax=Sphingomonas parva TaxID=2555898 RepID=A0A4Y8ZQ19_9SPHN|nr:hypothetical protein [Sphingomonas parva]TFI58101.1 hypothetical protein E2493_11915 [Sphingomonas parva]